MFDRSELMPRAIGMNGESGQSDACRLTGTRRSSVCIVKEYRAEKHESLPYHAEEIVSGRREALGQISSP